LTPTVTVTAATDQLGTASVSDSNPVANCNGAPSCVVEVGDTVTITATSHSGFAVAGWSGGGCSGTGTTCTLSPVQSNATVSVAFALSLVGIHLSRLSEDLILFASSEFQFIKISDGYTTGSSLMPQKKNPDVCELARGKTGRLIGNLVSLLTSLKGLPMTYNRDMQEDKEAVFDSIDQIKLVLEVYAGMILEIEVDSNRTWLAASDPVLLATDLADYLVLAGVPFRQAHEVIGKLVAYCIERNCGFPELKLEEFRQFSEKFGPDVFSVLNLDRAIDSRTAIGAPSRKNVAAALEAWNAILREQP